MITRSFTNSRNETHFIERNTNATIISMILMIDSINFHSCPKWSYLFWTIVHAGIDELGTNCVFGTTMFMFPNWCRVKIFRLDYIKVNRYLFIICYVSVKLEPLIRQVFFFSRFLLDSVKSISWSAFYFKRGTCEFYVNDLFPQGLILKKNRKKTRSSVLVRHWQCWSKLSPTQIFSLISLINMSWRHLFSSGV